MAIDRGWLREFAYKVKQCPRCKKHSFGLIFEGEISGEIWECANDECLYNPSCAGCQRRSH